MTLKTFYFKTSPKTKLITI